MNIAYTMFEHTLNAPWTHLEHTLNAPWTHLEWDLKVTQTWLERCTNGIFKLERYSNMARTMHERDFWKRTHLERDWVCSIIIQIPQIWTSALQLNWTGRDFERTHPGMRSGAPTPASQHYSASKTSRQGHYAQWLLQVISYLPSVQHSCTRALLGLQNSRPNYQ